MPSLASLRRASPAGPPSPNERLAMKRETVNPMPPSIDTAAIIFQFDWSGIGAMCNLTVSQEKMNMPMNLPSTSPTMIARLMPLTIVTGFMSSK